MNNLTIKRGEWIRGNKCPDGTKNNNVLWSGPRNCGCVIGHYMNKVEGISIENLSGCAQPEEVFNEFSDLSEEADKSKVVSVDYDGITDTRVVTFIMALNDDESCIDSYREGQLKEMFEKYLEVNLEFVD
jgi:hypothetical protein